MQYGAMCSMLVNSIIVGILISLLNFCAGYSTLTVIHMKLKEPGVYYNAVLAIVATIYIVYQVYQGFMIL